MLELFVIHRVERQHRPQTILVPFQPAPPQPMAGIERSDHPGNQHDHHGDDDRDVVASELHRRHPNDEHSDPSHTQHTDIRRATTTSTHLHTPSFHDPLPEPAKQTVDRSPDKGARNQRSPRDFQPEYASGVLVFGLTAAGCQSSHHVADAPHSKPKRPSTIVADR
ncbi:hypothetical protein [Nocardia grenadensis]|uniref:hypothetical protein n=1 Tax=Nocardia grenadensis TaxID=931537 RepID=UPI0012EECA4F|nr:hypothetical protein [Nocardia grenadensis]